MNITFDHNIKFQVSTRLQSLITRLSFIFFKEKPPALLVSEFNKGIKINVKMQTSYSVHEMNQQLQVFRSFLNI